nr:unnamed protein product [Digitaria exilis]
MEKVGESLVANVRQVLGDEYRLLSGVGGEVTELRDDLATMNALLRMQSEADEGAVDHFDQEWMKQLRELAYDAEDSVDLYKLRVKCRHGDGMAALWFKMVHLARTLTQRHRLAGEIRDLRAHAITISERHARYDIDRKALRSSATFAPVVALRCMPELQRGKSPDDSNKFVDIGGQAESFIKQLKKDEHDFKVFAVVGFGGVGKTTLAMEVCQRLAADFPYQAMVSVSQMFQPDRDLENLLKGILEQVVMPKTNDGKGVKEEKTVRIGELGAYLSDKSRWIAEGLVPEKRGCTLTEVAETYLDELVSRNMVVPSFIGFDGKVESCRVHDVLLEVMVSKSLESNFVSLLGEQYAGVSYDDRIRRLSIQGSSSSLGIEHRMEVKHVRSLSMFQLQKGHKLLDNLDRFVLLLVLDLEGCMGVTNQHVLHACKLYLLRFLSFKNTGISKVPPQVKKLEHLQVLNLEGTMISDGGLSDNVTTLKKLELLLCDWWILPKGIGKMKALRELDAVKLEDSVEIAQELGELKQLEAINITVGNSVSKEEVRQALATSLSKMYFLRSCSIFSDDDNLEFLHDLRTLPRRLRDIWIVGTVGPSLPAWIGQLTHLVTFDMSLARLNCDQLLGVLFKLPCLKRIDVGYLCCVDRELVARTNYRFPSLVSLEVSACETEEPGKFLFEQGSMPELERFQIDFGYRDNQVSIVGMEHLTNLKEVRLTGNKSSPALEHALQQVKAEKSKREESHQFQIPLSGTARCSTTLFDHQPIRCNLERVAEFDDESTGHERHGDIFDGSDLVAGRASWMTGSAMAAAMESSYLVDHRYCTRQMWQDGPE